MVKGDIPPSLMVLFKTLLLTEGTHCLLVHGWLDNAGTWDKVGYSYKQATRRSSATGGTPPNNYYHIYFIFSIYHILHRWCPSSTLSSTWWLSTCLAMASLLISPPVISFSKGAFIKYLFFLGRPSLSWHGAPGRDQGCCHTDGLDPLLHHWPFHGGRSLIVKLLKTSLFSSGRPRRPLCSRFPGRNWVPGDDWHGWDAAQVSKKNTYHDLDATEI